MRPPNDPEHPTWDPAGMISRGRHRAVIKLSHAPVSFGIILDSAAMESRKPKVLVVDDEPDAVELVAFNLRKAGIEVVTAETGVEAITRAREVQPDAIVLDLMLPEMDGLEVCQNLRRELKTAGIPVIMLTAKAGEVDRVLGLELGADDYLTKPFSPRELLLRVRKLLQPRQAPLEKEQFRVGELLIDLPKHEVHVGGSRIDLTLTEFKLIALMAQRCGRVQSREQLLTDVWDYHSPIETRTVDTHVRRLRDKLGPAAEYLDTVRGVGYRLVDRSAATPGRQPNSHLPASRRPKVS